MNAVLIAFLLFVIMFAIFVVAQYFNPDYLIRQSTPLNTMKSKTQSYPSVQHNIPVANIDNPGSIRYHYGGWFYIDANMPIDTQNVLFNRGNNFVVTLLGSTLNLYVNVTNNGGSGVSTSGILDTKGISPLLSVNNLPFQKWVHLVLNVDNTTVDLYIDGKFVKTVQNPTAISTNTTDPITYGNQYTLGRITRFKRPAENINPQGVWQNYMLGSGESNSITDYHLNAQLTKNRTVRIDQRIF